MWTLYQLREPDVVQAHINGKWVPARPENYKKKYVPWYRRLKYAWAVFTGRAEAFTWPENQ